jgi:hypothetical protein
LAILRAALDRAASPRAHDHDPLRFLQHLRLQEQATGRRPTRRVRHRSRLCRPCCAIPDPPGSWQVWLPFFSRGCCGLSKLGPNISGTRLPPMSPRQGVSSSSRLANCGSLVMLQCSPRRGDAAISGYAVVEPASCRAPFQEGLCRCARGPPRSGAGTSCLGGQRCAPAARS